MLLPKGTHGLPKALMCSRAREYQIAFVRAAIVLFTRICSDLLPSPWGSFREHVAGTASAPRGAEEKS
jgi:hypothetical protein